MKSIFRQIIIFVLFGSLITSCDTFAPSKLCGEDTEADHTAFNRFFSELQLIDLAITTPGDEQEQVGRVFKNPASLTIKGTLINESEIRLCIFGAKRNGEVVFDEFFVLSSGEQSISLGEFEEGPYIIRVYADGKLVENLSFLIQ